jgi:hypothetical protein
MISKRSDERGTAMLFSCFARAGWITGDVLQRRYVFVITEGLVVAEASG